MLENQFFLFLSWKFVDIIFHYFNLFSLCGVSFLILIFLIFFFLFKVMLTLMGDESTIPWRVLSIDFLVQDKETGGDLAINRHV